MIDINKTKSLLDAITSNNGYTQKMPYAISLTHLLSYPNSKDAIASKKGN